MDVVNSSPDSSDAGTLILVSSGAKLLRFKRDVIRILMTSDAKAHAMQLAGRCR